MPQYVMLMPEITREVLWMTVHSDDVNCLVYEMVRVVKECYPRRDTLIVAYQRLLKKNGVRGPENK